MHHPQKRPKNVNVPSKTRKLLYNECRFKLALPKFPFTPFIIFHLSLVDRESYHSLQIVIHPTHSRLVTIPLQLLLVTLLIVYDILLLLNLVRWGFLILLLPQIQEGLSLWSHLERLFSVDSLFSSWHFVQVFVLQMLLLL